MDEEIFINRVEAKCSQDGCDEHPSVYWPAFDADNPPKPYCSKHLEEAKKTYEPIRPHYLKMAKDEKKKRKVKT